VSPSRSGLLAAVSGYLLWALFPLYWPLLELAAPVEILAHRIVWSLAFLLALLALTSGFAWLRGLSRRTAGLLALAAALVSVNWGVYIYGVNSEHVVETSLGYFINPLLTVVLAIVFLHEGLRRRQAVALAVAAAGVLVLTVDYGRVPWIALTLALSFGLYGLVKNRAGVEGTQSLAVETAVIVLPAAAYLAWLGGTGRGTFTSEGWGHTGLLLGAGVVTAVPLMLFGTAAVRIRLSTLGLLQYMTPTIQFLIGVLLYGEPMPLSRLVGFALVWIALLIFMLDALGASRARLRAAPPAPAPA
jgi:chloramphenicol-sensitive protein RarD